MMPAAGLGLAAALSWGLSDFVAARKSRELPVFTVLLISQTAGLVAIGIVVAIRAQGLPDGKSLALAALAGIAATLGLAALYKGLSIGKIAVVAPIAATAPVVPLAVGFLTGDRIGAIQGAGVALALGGVVVISLESGQAEARGALAAGAGMAAVAAGCFGLFFVAMGAASDADLFWATFVQRLTGVTLLVTVATVLRRAPLTTRRHIPALATIGVLDTFAVGLFAAASTKGATSLVAVLASLYPAVTVVLGRALLGESLPLPKQLGAVAVLAGAALITAG